MKDDYWSLRTLVDDVITNVGAPIKARSLLFALAVAEQRFVDAGVCPTRTLYTDVQPNPMTAGTLDVSIEAGGKHYYLSPIDTPMTSERLK